MIHRPLRHPAPEGLRHPQAHLRLLLPVSEAQAAAVREAAAQAAVARAVLAQAAAVQAVAAQVRRPLALAVQQRVQVHLPTYWGPQTNYGCTSHILRCVPRPQEGPRSA